MIKEVYSRFRNLILYGIIGGFCAALDFGMYTVLCYWDFMPYLWANIISIHIGIFTSFVLNRSFNFKVKDKVTTRFLSSKGGWNEIVCKLISIVVVALIQFLLNKYITFRNKQ